MARRELSLDQDVMRARLDRVSIARGRALPGAALDARVREAVPEPWVRRGPRKRLLIGMPGRAWRRLRGLRR